MPPLSKFCLRDSLGKPLTTYTKAPMRFQKILGSFLWRHYFCLRQHFCLWRHNIFLIWKYIGKWRMTSQNDVIMSDFHQTFRKCFSYWYLTSVQISSHLRHLNRKYSNFCIFGYNMEIPIYFLPPPDKTPISRLLEMEITPNVLKMCKIKLK